MEDFYKKCSPDAVLRIPILNMTPMIQVDNGMVSQDAQNKRLEALFKVSSLDSHSAACNGSLPSP